MANSRFTERTGAKPVLAASSAVAIKMLGNKTLNEIGYELKLEDGDVLPGHSLNPTNGEKYPCIVFNTKAGIFAVPFSRNFDHDMLTDPEYLLDCKIRLTNKQVVVDGEPVFEEDGVTPKLDETAPYLSFGKPEGLTFEIEETSIFAEPNKAKKAAAVTGMKGRK